MRSHREMTIKTDISRFHIHDELTAPDESARIIKRIQTAGGAVAKFIGVLAGAPAALRAYMRMRHELRGGVLPRATRERIALAVAELRGDSYSVAQHARTGRGRPSAHLVEEARELGWTDEQLLEAVAHLALSEFQTLVANAAALPQDQSDPKILPAAA